MGAPSNSPPAAVSSPDRVFATLLRWPPTWAVLAVVCALEAAFIGWFMPPFTVLAGSLGLGLVLLGLWPVLARRSPAFAAKLYAIDELVRAEARFDLDRLRADLERLEAGQALDQLRMIRQKLDSLTEVLERRLDAGELTFGRYLATAEQVYLATLDNLQDIAVTLTSVSSIDREYIDRRLAEIGDTDIDQTRELETLAQRQDLHEQQLRKVADLYAQNESAMTVLDNTATALAGTKTGRGHAAVDAEAAMAALEELARRADKYATTT